MYIMVTVVNKTVLNISKLLREEILKVLNSEKKILTMPVWWQVPSLIVVII